MSSKKYTFEEVADHLGKETETLRQLLAGKKKRWRENVHVSNLGLAITLLNDIEPLYAQIDDTHQKKYNLLKTIHRWFGKFKASNKGEVGDLILNLEVDHSPRKRNY